MEFQLKKFLFLFSLIYVVFGQQDATDRTRIPPTTFTPQTSNSDRTRIPPTTARIFTPRTPSKMPPTAITCPNARMLLDSGCTKNCIVLTRESYPCLACNRSCTGMMDECSLGDSSACRDDEICLPTGIAGRFTCVDRLREGDRCDGFDDDDDDNDDDLEDNIFQHIRTALPDLDARDVVSRLHNVVVPCRRGLTCKREALDKRVCRSENQNGPCIQARARDRDQGDVNCDEDGNFQPLQCRKESMNRLQSYLCRCVHANGTAIGTDMRVQNLRDAPDCEDKVHRRCAYQSSSRFSYEVRSGEEFINLERTGNCSRCLCRDGQPKLCVRLPDVICHRLNPSPVSDRSCTVRGRTLAHGDSIILDCNRCNCRNGVLTCSRRTCGDDDNGEEDDDDNGDPSDPEPERRCRQCGAMRAEPVCGKDGRTYPSRCFATECRGLDAEDLTPGPCSKQDVCVAYPCNGTKICLRRGGVTCLSRSGCRPIRFRSCIDPRNLICRTNATNDDNGEDTTVCGDDGETYSSICRLVQDSIRVQVSYAGRCDRQECSDDPVCGTDGVTYNNTCELRAQSANARVDYRGACMDAGATTRVSDICQRLRRSGRCGDVSDCSSVVQPEDGCCPVCGGAVTLGFDRDALDEYIRQNPSLETLDEFLTTLVGNGFIPENILRLCRVAVTLLRTGDVHIVLENIQRAGSACRMFVEQIAEKINNPASAVTTSSPQALQFATVAQSSPPISTNGARPAISFSLALLLFPLVAILFQR